MKRKKLVSDISVDFFPHIHFCSYNLFIAIVLSAPSNCLFRRYIWFNNLNLSLILFRMEMRWRKGPSSSTTFPPITSLKVRISPQNFLTFSLNLRPYLVPVLIYWTWTKTTPQKSHPLNIVSWCCYGQKLWSHNLFFKILLF